MSGNGFRGLNRSVPIFALLVLTTTALIGCSQCPDEPREREAALALAREYVADYLDEEKIALDAATFEILTQRYQEEDRAWYFRLRSRDGRCDIEVAVPDCEPTEFAGGGCNSG